MVKQYVETGKMSYMSKCRQYRQLFFGKFLVRVLVRKETSYETMASETKYDEGTVEGRSYHDDSVKQ